MPLLLAAACLAIQTPAKGQPSPLLNMKPPATRFQLEAPLPSLPAVIMDTYQSRWGYVHQAAKTKGLQARIMWIDCTANLDRFNDEEKIMGLVAKIADSGFNTIAFDIKPISGQVVYPSRFAPRLKEWKGKTLPEGFDPLAVFVRECKAAGLSLLVSMNAFSEGHRDFKVGPGYDLLDQQTVIYEARPVVRLIGRSYSVFPIPNRMPEGEDQLGVFTDLSKMPVPAPELFAVTLNRDAKVLDGFEQGGIGQGVPTIPSGGCVLVGRGIGADFLRQTVIPGETLSIDTETAFLPMSARPELQITLMMNPHHPTVQSRMLDIVREVVSTYEVDGVLFDDRMRYAGINADFSAYAMAEFERWVGRKLTWPDDVYKIVFTPSFSRGIRPGPWYDAWLAWRSLTLRNFVAKVKQAVKGVRQSCLFGIYAGSWYGEYPNLGANYASSETEAGFWFMTPQYQKTGFAGQLDLFISGCYYPTATIFEAMGKGTPIGVTIESAGEMANRLIRDRAWTYAGIMLSQFRGDPDGLGRALQAACAATQGVMVFDLSHEADVFWPYFRMAFSKPAKAPHAFPDVLRDASKKRLASELRGEKDRPMIVMPGAPGAGQ